jgi:hypothetical protein
MDAPEHVHIQKTATNAGLIGRHHNTVPRPVQPRDRFETTGDRNPFLWRFDKFVGVVIDDTVTIKND